MERKEYNAPSVVVIPAFEADVIATSKIELPPHIIGKSASNENNVGQY